MAAFPADARGGKAQRISADKERSRQIALAAKVKRAGSVGNWRGVLGLLDTPAFIPDTYVWREAIAAMGGQWQEAVKLLDRMEREGVQPNEFHYGAAITVCNRAKQWQKAEQLFKDLRSKGLQPTVFTYSAMITAY
eukprot:9583-Heterococcus_DN1.PRE.1